LANPADRVQKDNLAQKKICSSTTFIEVKERCSQGTDTLATFATLNFTQCFADAPSNSLLAHKLTRKLCYIQAKNRSTGTAPDAISRDGNPCSPVKTPNERYCRSSNTNTSIVRRLRLTSQYSGTPACSYVSYLVSRS